MSAKYQIDKDVLLVTAAPGSLTAKKVHSMKSKAAEIMKKQGISILLVDQIAKMALELSDRVYIIEKGLIQFSGAPNELIKNEQILLQYLGVKINNT